MRFGTSASEKMRLTSTGLGILNSSPSTPLEVNGAVKINEANGTTNGTLIIDSLVNGNPQIRFYQNGSIKAYLNYLDASDTLALSDVNGNGLHFSPSTQRVGIGTSSPSAKLHVETADSGVTPHANADQLFVEDNGHSGITIGSSTSTGGNIYFGDSADNSIGRINYDHSADRMNFTTNTQAGFFMQTMTNVTITTSYANMLTIPFGGYLIEIGSSANNASREIWLVLRNGAAYSAATTRLLQRTGNDGPRTYNIRVPADGILEAKLDSGSTITDAKITLFKFGM